MNDDVGRRELLGLLGGASASSAGCMGAVFDDESPIPTGEEPAFGPILAEAPGEQYLVVSIPTDVGDAFVDESEADAVASTDVPDDPLLLNPIAYLVIGASVVRFAFGFAGLTEIIAEYTRTPTEQGRYMLVNDVVIHRDWYDVWGAAAALESTDRYTAVVVDDDAVVLAGDGTAVGITDSALLFVGSDGRETTDPVARIETSVATMMGREQPRHARDETLDWLLRSGDTTGATVGLMSEDTLSAAEMGGLSAGVHPEPAFDPFFGALGVVQHLDVEFLRTEESSSAFASAVAAYPDEGSMDADGLEAGLGSEASERAFHYEPDRVRVEATYADPAIR